MSNLFPVGTEHKALRTKFMNLTKVVLFGRFFRLWAGWLHRPTFFQHVAALCRKKFRGPYIS